MKIAFVVFDIGVPTSDACAYPLGPMYISSVLKKMGHEVTVINQNIKKEFISVKDYDVVLMTSYERFLPEIKKLAAICKLAKVKTILGGTLATFRPEEMAQYVDTVIVGEGETVINRALDGQGVIIGECPKLDDLPYPDYDGFGIDQYHKKNGFRHIGIMSSRGCPHKCIFCSQTCEFQLRGLDSVFVEIDHYKTKYDVQLVVFYDNTLNLSKKRFMDICARIKQYNVFWSAAIRVDVWDEEMIVSAKESGLRYLVVGVESFNQSKLDKMNKRITVSQINNALSLIHKHGISYHAMVLVGLPWETEQDIRRELQSIPADSSVFPLVVQPYAGSNIEGRAVSDNYIEALNRDFYQHNTSRGMTQYDKTGCA